MPSKRKSKSKEKKIKSRTVLVKLWYFTTTSLTDEQLREKTLAMWRPFLGDALENVEIDDMEHDPEEK